MQQLSNRLKSYLGRNGSSGDRSPSTGHNHRHSNNRRLRTRCQKTPWRRPPTRRVIVCATDLSSTCLSSNICPAKPLLHTIRTRPARTGVLSPSLEHIVQGRIRSTHLMQMSKWFRLQHLMLSALGAPAYTSACLRRSATLPHHRLLLPFIELIIQYYLLSGSHV